MELKSLYDSISEKDRLILATEATRLALPVWDNFASSNELKYEEGVIGLEMEVDPKLVHSSVDWVEEKRDAEEEAMEIRQLLEEFSGPMVAIQDHDWSLPANVEAVLYGSYHLLRSQVDMDDPDHPTADHLWEAIRLGAQAVRTRGKTAREKFRELTESFNQMVLS